MRFFALVLILKWALPAVLVQTLVRSSSELLSFSLCLYALEIRNLVYKGDTNRTDLKLSTPMMFSQVHDDDDDDHHHHHVPGLLQTSTILAFQSSLLSFLVILFSL